MRGFVCKSVSLENKERSKYADCINLASGKTGETFDGASMVPLLGGGNETAKGACAPKTAAFSQYPRKVKDPRTPWKDNGIIHTDRATFTHMGYSVRVADWRYTEWVAWNGAALLPVWSDVRYRELYDFRGVAAYPTDFDAAESVNVANSTELADVVSTLAAMIRAQYGPGAEEEEGTEGWRDEGED